MFVSFSMTMIRHIILCTLFGVALCQKTLTVPSSKKYEPTWDSLDSRPIPVWYDDAKIGIFIHWGVFSVPSFGSEWFWHSWKVRNLSEYNEFMERYPSSFSYQEFGKDLTGEFFDPKAWAELFKKAGAQYVVLTSKHHEGYTLWPSKYSYSWNSVDVGPHRDIVGELSAAVKAENLTFGLYHSLYEWFNPMYLDDKANKFMKDNYVVRKVLPEMTELIETYKPHILWSDGDWEASEDYWESRKFLAWLYNYSPVKDKIVVNDRWGINITCQHGDFFTCQDRFNPGVLQRHKWENAMTIDRKSWGFRRNAELNDYLTTHELLKTMIETVSCGGNILINVGPTKEGTIELIYQERLLDIGTWLSVNGEAIYATRPWAHQNDTASNTWYTARANVIYAHTLEWPADNRLKLANLVSIFESIGTVQLLGHPDKLNVKLEWTTDEKVVVVEFPNKATVTTDWVYVIKIVS